MSRKTRKTDKSRRKFIAKTAEYGIALAALSSGCATFKGFRSISSDEDRYDYIVIGSGAGGGPVAANLAKAGFRVLILEAGEVTTGTDYETPALHVKSTENPGMSWQFFVKHYNDAARAANDTKYDAGRSGIFYPRAGTVGGCTAHNAMITLYPDNQDWDNLASLTGDSSWGSEGMRTYFQRLENALYLRPEVDNGVGHHGFKGWLGVEQVSPKLAFKDPRLLAFVLAAAHEEGVAREIINKIIAQDLNLKLDPNDWQYVLDKADGLFNIPKATYRGRRNGTREHILSTMSQHPDKLFMRTNSFATRLLFDHNQPNKVIGVEYLEGRHLYRADPNASTVMSPAATRKTVFASKEVIVAGGAFNSPQLLMLSGIGPSEDLERGGVPVRVRLPGVGRNLQDRYEVGVVSEIRGEFDVLKHCTFGEPGDPCLDDFRNDPQNTMYSANGAVIAIIRRSSPGKPSPDLCVFGLPGNFRGYYPGYSSDVFHKDRFTWAVLKGHTYNTGGYVTLRSGDPLETPEINFRYFDDGNDASGDDLESVLAGVKFARKINRNLLLRALIKDEVTPGPDYEDDDDLRQFIQNESWGHHASCTNKMGPASDPMAVVDSRFRVHGTQGLRVVDASVFPRIPGLFIVVPVYMIAEKASDAIIEDA